MYNNNRTSSNKQLKTVSSQQLTPTLKTLESLKTEGIQYYYHQGYERKQLHKIFDLNTKKRHIQRYINQCVYNADLNGISLKTSQIDRFNLYQKDLTDELKANSKSYNSLNKYRQHAQSTDHLFNNKQSQHRDLRITSGLKIPSIQQQQEILIKSKVQIRPKREDQLVQAIKKDNLFTIVYKSNIFSN